jgi:salicylate 5-hydroxylase large subunit
MRNKRDDTKGAEEMASLKADYELQDPRMIMPVKEFPDDISIMIQTLFPDLIVQQQTNSLQLRYVIPLGPDSFELSWTYLGYDDDDAEMRLRRLRQANLTGPSGYISVDDSEVMEFSGAGVRPNPAGVAIAELDGKSPWPTKERHMVTESAIRGFYHHYRNVMGYS